MKIGVLKETKPGEGRVALTPHYAKLLFNKGHTVLVEKGAGIFSGHSDKDYRSAGCTVINTSKQLISKSDLILKVKEPSIGELNILSSSQIFFSFLHLAAFPDLLRIILKRKLDVLAYETIEINGLMPILRPMSQIAGKLATQIGINYLRRDMGGKGILAGGTDKVAPANVLILGGGVVGQSAAQIALGVGARTYIYEISVKRQEFLKQNLMEAIVIDDANDLTKLVEQADLVIGAVLTVGQKAPVVVSRDMVKKMEKGSVIIDVSVDQGGCIATSEVTTLQKPIVIKHGVLHYGVCNMPGSVPRTSTDALVTESYHYIEAIAEHGFEGAQKVRPELYGALNCSGGEIVHPGLLKSVTDSTRK